MKYLKLISSLSLFLFAFNLHAQNLVQFTIQGTVGDVVYVNQLFGYFNATSSMVNPLQVKLLVEVESASGSELLSAETNLFQIQNGTTGKSLEMQVGYNLTYSSSTIGQLLQSTGLIPIGEYTALYTLVNENQTVEYASFGREFSVGGLSDPIAISPTNNEEVLNCIPTISWIPVFPINASIKYELILVDVIGNQSSYDAILENAPLVNLTDLSSTNVQIPSSMLLFNDSTTYAWQVHAYLDDFLVGSTDISDFTSSCSLSEVIEAPEELSYEGYIEPLVDDPGCHIAKAGDTIKILFRNTENLEFLNYDIVYTDSTSNILTIPLTDLPTVELEAGTNLVDIPVNTFSEYLKENEIFYIKFTFTGNEIHTKYLYLQEE